MWLRMCSVCVRTSVCDSMFVCVLARSGREDSKEDRRDPGHWWPPEVGEDQEQRDQPGHQLSHPGLGHWVRGC